MDNLKPCPFCGGEAKIKFESEERHVYAYRYIVCNNCFGNTGWKNTEKEAIDAWNKRVTPIAPLPELNI